MKLINLNHYIKISYGNSKFEFGKFEIDQIESK